MARNYKQIKPNTMTKEKQLQNLTDISIQILDMLVQYDFVQDCFDTDNETEFFVQDKINDILIKNLLKSSKIDTMKLQDINTIQDVEKFFQHIVYDLGINFHVDTPFTDYVYNYNDKPCFTKKEALRYQIMMERCDFICQIKKVDIYEIALNTLQSFIKL
jgi:hypothetical protein